MIIFTHHIGEPYGILGAQIAATFFHEKLSIPSFVVGIERNFSKEGLIRFIEEYYRGKEKIVGFSHLCGRKDLIELIKELKEKGFITILGGPQAKPDYTGESEEVLHPHRFHGLKSFIDITFQGPINGFTLNHLDKKKGLFKYPWTKDIYLKVDWSNIYTFSNTLKKLDIRLGQVLNSIGCPYAKKFYNVLLPPPTNLRERDVPEIEIQSEGCIFCDVSRDKGYHGSMESNAVLAQITELPEHNGRKISFELIDEYPIRFLGNLLEEVKQEKIQLSQINLVCRVDDINSHLFDLENTLSIASALDIKIMFSSIGFESFSDRLLQYFCKGITIEDIVKCVETLRRLKKKFENHLLYRREEGANHGFIRPTPWDDGETLQEIDRNIFLYRFFEDILPEYSTPLIIHHASYLGDWIRKIESMTGIIFNREGTWIEWWNPIPN